MKIKRLSRKEIENAIPLVWEVFLEYEAVNYPESGKQAFRNAIHSEEYLDSLSAYGAFGDEELIGIIATRNEGSHLALFFVKGSYQGKGIGRMLWNKAYLQSILERLSESGYKDNFILKGGLLISSMIGIAERTTMDMDTTVRGISMDEDTIRKAMEEIISTNIDDDIHFELTKMKPIREEDEYNNFRVHLMEIYGIVNNPIKIDITTGDKITPAAIEHTAAKMGSLSLLKDYVAICRELREEQALHTLWINYTKDNPYASHLRFDDLVENVLEFGKYIE